MHGVIIVNYAEALIKRSVLMRGYDTAQLGSGHSDMLVITLIKRYTRYIGWCMGNVKEVDESDGVMLLDGLI